MTFITNASPAVASEDDPLGTYARWNVAIGKHFFNPRASGLGVRLSFDDGAATTIGRAFDESADDLCAALNDLVRTDALDPFALLRLFESSQDYWGLALLAVQVLAASKMGEDPQADVQRFWPIFFELVGGEFSQKQIDEHIDPMWLEYEAFYNTKLGGARGLVTLPPDPLSTPLKLKRHINYPLWQCTLREADREQLRRRFQIASSSELSASSSRLTALVRDWAELNPTLRNTLKWAKDNPEFDHQLGVLLEEVRDSARETTFRPEDRRRLISRLRLVGLYKLSCYLQVRSDTGQWLDSGHEGQPLTSDQLKFGVDAAAFGGSWAGATRLAFLDAENEGFIYLRGSMNGAADVVLLYVVDDRVGTLLQNDSRWTPRELDVSLADGYRAFQGRIDPGSDAELAASFGVQLLREKTMAFEGGLRIGAYGSTTYLFGAPPRIHILVPSGKPLIVDGERIETDSEYVAVLPPTLAIGQHTVQYGKDESSLQMVAVDESENEQGDELGWILSADGLMTTGPSDDERTSLIGAELRQP